MFARKIKGVWYWVENYRDGGKRRQRSRGRLTEDEIRRHDLEPDEEETEAARRQEVDVAVSSEESQRDTGGGEEEALVDGGGVAQVETLRDGPSPDPDPEPAPYDPVREKVLAQFPTAEFALDAFTQASLRMAVSLAALMKHCPGGKAEIEEAVACLDELCGRIGGIEADLAP